MYSYKYITPFPPDLSATSLRLLIGVLGGCSFTGFLKESEGSLATNRTIKCISSTHKRSWST